MFDLDGWRFVWLREPGQVAYDGATVTATAAAGTDNFRAPDGSNVADTGAVALTDAPEGDWQFHARVRVTHRNWWDAGTVVVWRDEQHWAKLCFELSPQEQSGIMSVVTRGRSDDAVGWPISGGEAWLRISRRDGAFYFHASSDGIRWSLARQFELGDVAALRVGLGVQSPAGDGCTAVFDQVSLSATRLDQIFT
jgi:uncharacterized protein